MEKIYTVKKVNGEWAIDVSCEPETVALMGTNWLPLPFTPHASLETVKAGVETCDFAKTGRIIFA